MTAISGISAKTSKARSEEAWYHQENGGEADGVAAAAYHAQKLNGTSREGGAAFGEQKIANAAEKRVREIRGGCRRTVPRAVETRYKAGVLSAQPGEA